MLFDYLDVSQDSTGRVIFPLLQTQVFKMRLNRTLKMPISADSELINFNIALFLGRLWVD